MGTPEAGKFFLQALTGSGLDGDSLEENYMFDSVALHTIRDIKAYKGRLTCIIPVEPRVQNRYGTLHGGCIGKTVCQQASDCCSFEHQSRFVPEIFPSNCQAVSCTHM